MPGADGVMLGSRLWASPEALVHPNHQRVALAANGDGTIRQKSADIARGYDWPEEFTGRGRGVRDGTIHAEIQARDDVGVGTLPPLFNERYWPHA
jgi:hypothetical protein